MSKFYVNRVVMSKNIIIPFESFKKKIGFMDNVESRYAEHVHSIISKLGYTNFTHYLDLKKGWTPIVSFETFMMNNNLIEHLGECSFDGDMFMIKQVDSERNNVSTILKGHLNSGYFLQLV